MPSLLYTERGAGALHDYLFATIEKEVLHDDVKLTLSGAWEVADWGDGPNRYGYGFFPELTYQAIDNLDLQIGAFIVEGTEASLFGQWNEIDQVYLRAKVQF